MDAPDFAVRCVHVRRRERARRRGDLEGWRGTTLPPSNNGIRDLVVFPAADSVDEAISQVGPCE